MVSRPGGHGDVPAWSPAARPNAASFSARRAASSMFPAAFISSSVDHKGGVGTPQQRGGRGSDPGEGLTQCGGRLLAHDPLLRQQLRPAPEARQAAPHVRAAGYPGPGRAAHAGEPRQQNRPASLD
ncbi:hypothetical protein ACPCSC_33165 [Streptomyces lavendulocolor]|uniref:hypothetical protein n=1 Tax=Streptomyces lavendulocolor TaxID=67316 RepID=UPI003C2D48FF